MLVTIGIIELMFSSAVRKAKFSRIIQDDNWEGIEAISSAP